MRSFTRRACGLPPDVLGSPGGGLADPHGRPRGSIPTIAEVLELARVTGSKVNLEIKNVPTDPDYDTTSAYANRVMDVVSRVRLPRSQLLIQSFIPANLDAAKRRLQRACRPACSPSRLGRPRSPRHATRGTWLSPQWPFTAAFVRAAHRATSSSPPTRSTSAPTPRPPPARNVDAVITDDPLMAAAALGLRPVKALTAKLTRRGARVEASRPAPLVPRRKLCNGSVTLRVLGAKRTLRARTTTARRGLQLRRPPSRRRAAPACAPRSGSAATSACCRD